MTVHIAVHVYVKRKSGTSLHSVHALSRVSFRFRSNRAGKPGGRLRLWACGPVRFSAAAVRRRKSFKKKLPKLGTQHETGRARARCKLPPVLGAGPKASGCHRSSARARKHQAATGPSCHRSRARQVSSATEPGPGGPVAHPDQVARW